jgi:hypothetical protein
MVNKDRSQRHLWLRALGARDMPESIELEDGAYHHVRTYKHDFFAATGLYEGPSGRVILKIGRQAPLLGLPMKWLGQALTRRELAFFERVDDLPGVPRCLGGWGETGLVHLFVEGHPLQKKEQVNDGFFPRLAELIDKLHERGIAYVDLEKRENILVGDDGNPWLIDFQISWRWAIGPDRRRQGMIRLMPHELGLFLLERLQQADRYHLLKHRRRHRPDTMTEAEIEASYRRGAWAEVYRRVARPLTLLRRAALKTLTGKARSQKQDGPEFMKP